METKNQIENVCKEYWITPECETIVISTKTMGGDGSQADDQFTENS
jgi:hypothetical protein